MKKILFNVTLTCLALLTNQAFAEEKKSKQTYMRITHFSEENTGKHAILEKFKTLIGENGDKIKIELNSKSNQDKKESRELDYLDFGVTDVTLSSTELVKKNYKAYSVELLELPYLFSDLNDVEKFLSSPISKYLISDINEKNNYSELLAILPEDPVVIIGPEFIKNTSEFKDKKFLVDSTNDKSYYLENVNVNKQIVFNYNIKNLLKELTNEKNEITKYAIVPMSYLNTKEFDNLKYKVTLNQSNYTFNILTVNKRWFYNLPENIRKNINQSKNYLLKYSIENMKENIEKNKEILNRKKVDFYTWNDKDIRELKKKIIPLHESYLEKEYGNYLAETYINLQQ